MLQLINLLGATGIGIETEKLKVHLACFTGHEHPIDVFLSGGFEEWQQRQNRKNFECRQVLSLIDLKPAMWLFAGVYEVRGRTPIQEGPESFRYELHALPNQEELIGRVIVYYKKPDRTPYPWYDASKHLFPIVEMRPERLSIGQFPGYKNVQISFARLKIIIGQKLESWHGALAHAQGIYLITDTSTGRLYVGKASGNERLWQRWSEYARDGHGGNVKLRKLLAEKGFSHAENFQFSILEILDPSATEAEVLARESHWMNALRTRDFGLN